MKSSGPFYIWNLPLFREQSTIWRGTGTDYSTLAYNNDKPYYVDKYDISLEDHEGHYRCYMNMYGSVVSEGVLLYPSTGNSSGMVA